MNFNEILLDIVPDPNLAYLFDKLKGAGIFTGCEMKGYNDLYFNPERAFCIYIKPVARRFSKRYRLASEVVLECRKMLKVIEKEGGSTNDRGNAERRVSEAIEAINELDLFNKDLNSYVQIYKYEPAPLGAYRSEDQKLFYAFAIDLRQMLHQELHEICGPHDERDIPVFLRGVSTWPVRRISVYGTTPIEELNNLLGTEETDEDKLDWLQGIASKIAENQSLMKQIRNSPRDANFHNVVDTAVMALMGKQNAISLSSHYLLTPDVANCVQSLLLDILLKGLVESSQNLYTWSVEDYRYHD